MINSPFFKIYLLPGITFQSLVISGGYCTGQEIIQYFLSSGPVNGFYGLLVTTVFWSLTCALCFVFAKMYQAYDYKRFFKALLGRGWIAFEACYIYLVIIALSVITASVGSMLHELIGLPYIVGLLLPLFYIFIMVIKGSVAIEKMFSLLSFVLYGVFMAFVICCYQKNTSAMHFTSLPSGYDWALQGFKYACYNLGCLPAILFTLRHIKTCKQAALSGLLAGPLASTPGILLFIALLTEYPAILNSTVPSTFMLNQLAIPILTLLFSGVLIATLVETGVGLVHAFNDRIIHSFGKTKLNYIGIVSLLLVAFALSQFGLVNLITQGYGILTWFMIAVFIIPLLTIGSVKIMGSNIK